MATLTKEILTLDEVMDVLKCSRSTLYAWMEGRFVPQPFPLPIKVGRENRWIESEVEEWLRTRPRAVIQSARAPVHKQ